MWWKSPVLAKEGGREEGNGRERAKKKAGRQGERERRNTKSP